MRKKMIIKVDARIGAKGEYGMFSFQKTYSGSMEDIEEMIATVKKWSKECDACIDFIIDRDYEEKTCCRLFNDFGKLMTVSWSQAEPEKAEIEKKDIRKYVYTFIDKFNL